MSCVNLYLCCHGNADRDGFTFCNSTKNKIINFATLDIAEVDTKKLMEFISGPAGLSDGPVISNNKSFNIINIMHRDFGLLKQEDVLKIQKYFILHKDCGIFLELISE